MKCRHLTRVYFFMKRPLSILIQNFSDVDIGICCLGNIYRPQRSWGKVMFLQASVILLTGGYLAPPTRADTPRDQTPPGADTTPQTRPPRSRHPLWSRSPPGPDPPGSRHHPPLDQTPPEQTPRADTPRSRHPPGPDPTRRACCEIRSTRGRYASYWNASCLSCR